MVIEHETVTDGRRLQMHHSIGNFERVFDMGILDLCVLGPPIEPAFKRGHRSHFFLQQTPAWVGNGVGNWRIHIAVDAALNRAEPFDIPMIVQAAGAVVDGTGMTRIYACDLFRGKKAEPRDVGEDARDVERCDLKVCAFGCTFVTFATRDNRFIDAAHDLKCSAIYGGDVMTKDEIMESQPTARDYLDSEFKRARTMLVDFENGAARMRESQKEFDETWGNIIKTAVRLYGKTATRDALAAMGRPEDATKMY